jgi:predicted transcriptional regulator
LSSFERGQIIGVHLAEASVKKTATLLGVSRVTVSKFMLEHTNHGKTISVKRISGQKSTMTERDHRTLKGLFQKITELRSTGDSRTEYSS